MMRDLWDCGCAISPVRFLVYPPPKDDFPEFWRCDGYTFIHATSGQPCHLAAWRHAGLSNAWRPGFHAPNSARYFAGLYPFHSTDWIQVHNAILLDPTAASLGAYVPPEHRQSELGSSWAWNQPVARRGLRRHVGIVGRRLAAGITAAAVGSNTASCTPGDPACPDLSQQQYHSRLLTLKLRERDL
eukprot:1191972-Prorocentrum_minimum.AAC.2